MRLIGLKFVNSLGHPVKVTAVKLGEDSKRRFVFYYDARPEFKGNNYVMKLLEHTFIRRYRKSLEEFKKEK